MKVNGSIISEAFGSLHIQNDAIAIAEQIKNSIDAQANNVTVDLRDYISKILIIDDGSGLSKTELVEEWNSVGNQEKSSDNEALGGKGIGRFSLFRLGNKMTILSKLKNNVAYKITCKVAQFDGINDISNLNFKSEEVSDLEWYSLTKNNHGTVVVLEDIVDRIFFRTIDRGLSNVQNPLKNKSVNINVLYPNDYEEILKKTVVDSINYAPFKIEAMFENGRFIKVVATTSLKDKLYYQEDIDLGVLNDRLNTQLINEEEGFEISQQYKMDIGKIFIKIYNFNFDRSLVNKFKIPDKELQNDFLSIHMGINIFRNDIKIFGHGESDFLKLAEERLKRTDRNIDNKFTFGVIEIENTTKELLIEQTNREGFILNDASRLLNLIIKLITKEVGLLRLNTNYLLIKDDPLPRNKIKLDKRERKIIQPYLNFEQLLNTIKDRIKSSTSDDFKLTVDETSFNESDLNPQIIQAVINFEDGSVEVIDFEVSRKTRTPKHRESIINIDPTRIDKLKQIHPKLSILLTEITEIDIHKFPNTVALMLRTIIEVTSNEYIIVFNKKFPKQKVPIDYDYEHEQLIKKNSKKVSSKDRTHYLVTAIKLVNNKYATVGLESSIQSFIDEGNYTTHKQTFVMTAKSLLDFFANFANTFDHMLDFIVNNG